MAHAKNAGWWDSLRTLLTRLQAPRQQQPAAPQAPTGPQDMNTKMQIIHKAATSRTLIYMKYNGQHRYVEPYSYRTKSTGQLFYGFCYKDQHIESFVPDRIEEVQNTELTYQPRWDVEIGKS